ncbi:hypothetical protein [Conexibacter sp. SYSU D00693]|uniref:hypothetical protein n=1 Tax=Conexibacter sp. SYSU D00693 TaxID=2812560 RepID=UPI00196B5CB4|nr:hypothetical protein [Conexibacter sp. SYSU D00693]
MDDAHVPVSLQDAEVASGIARHAREGGEAERRPTPGQLLLAFGAQADTPEERRRIAAALDMAGVLVEPSLLDAPADQRVRLVPRGGSGRGGGARRAVVGLVAVAVVLGAGAAAASLLVEDDGGQAVTDALPAGTTGQPAPTTSTLVPPATTATATTATTATTTAASTGTGATTTAAGPAATGETDPEADEPTAAERAAARRRARERAAARKRAAARRKTVTVRVDASARPTFLCVEDGDGRQLFNGTLTGRRTFRATQVRLNVGLQSTVITAGGRPIPLDGSPDGLAITRRGVTQLPLGSRPCA